MLASSVNGAFAVTEHHVMQGFLPWEKNAMLGIDESLFCLVALGVLQS